jgi:hypothetical protein
MGVFDFAGTKALVRQAVHDYLSVDATYKDSEFPDGIGITVRWHDKINRFGNLENMGWAERVEGIDRLIFNNPELAGLGVTLDRNATVFIPSVGLTFALDVAEAEDGPIETVWIVVKQ